MMPDPTRLSAFWVPLLGLIHKHASTLRIYRSESGELCCANELLLRGDSSIAGLLSSLELQEASGLQFAATDQPELALLSEQQVFSVEHLLLVLEQPSFSPASKTHRWRNASIKMLLQDGSLETVPRMRALPIWALENGEFGRLDDGVIWRGLAPEVERYQLALQVLDSEVAISVDCADKVGMRWGGVDEVLVYVLRKHLMSDGYPRSLPVSGTDPTQGQREGAHANHGRPTWRDASECWNELKFVRDHGHRCQATLLPPADEQGSAAACDALQAGHGSNPAAVASAATSEDGQTASLRGELGLALRIPTANGEFVPACKICVPSLLGLRIPSFTTGVRSVAHLREMLDVLDAEGMLQADEDALLWEAWLAGLGAVVGAELPKMQDSWWELLLPRLHGFLERLAQPTGNPSGSLLSLAEALAANDMTRMVLSRASSPQWKPLACSFAEGAYKELAADRVQYVRVAEAESSHVEVLQRLGVTVRQSLPGLLHCIQQMYLCEVPDDGGDNTTIAAVYERMYSAIAAAAQEADPACGSAASVLQGLGHRIFVKNSWQAAGELLPIHGNAIRWDGDPALAALAGCALLARCYGTSLRPFFDFCLKGVNTASQGLSDLTAADAMRALHMLRQTQTGGKLDDSERATVLAAYEVIEEHLQQQPSAGQFLLTQNMPLCSSEGRLLLHRGPSIQQRRLFILGEGGQQALAGMVWEDGAGVVDESMLQETPQLAAMLQLPRVRECLSRKLEHQGWWDTSTVAAAAQRFLKEWGYPPLEPLSVRGVVTLHEQKELRCDGPLLASARLPLTHGWEGTSALLVCGPPKAAAGHVAAALCAIWRERGMEEARVSAAEHAAERFIRREVVRWEERTVASFCSDICLPLPLYEVAALGQVAASRLSNSAHDRDSYRPSPKRQHAAEAVPDMLLVSRIPRMVPWSC